MGWSWTVSPDRFQCIPRPCNRVDCLAVNFVGIPSSFGHAGATCGVTVSTSAFLSCHQICCAGSSLALGVNLRAVAYVIF